MLDLWIEKMAPDGAGRRHARRDAGELRAARTVRIRPYGSKVFANEVIISGATHLQVYLEEDLLPQLRPTQPWCGK
ncbi:hypothetical protein DSL92_03635 [Billgrantia gudaonensis]|uniref:Uncharacterized protein n=1 Tax=Billgrantia gudaonensis TaxID=376427 RepID=A0A432JJP4_9GAMM|nr:hypothetical protein DSL92_03635 [Halomonas gudaonensis]